MLRDNSAVGLDSNVSVHFRCLTSRLATLLVFVFIYLGINLITRIGLMIYSIQSIDFDLSLIASYGIGFGFDLLNCLYYATPLALGLALIPNRIWTHLITKIIVVMSLLVFTGLWLFTAVSEFVFWEEFGVRFNFIAVDYLVYTQEVLNNIKESYPMPLIFSGLAVATLLITIPPLRFLFRHWSECALESVKRRWGLALSLLIFTSLSALIIHQRQIPFFQNNYHRELAKNGTFSLFSAFWNNELSYPEFYSTLPADAIDPLVRKELSNPTTTFTSEEKNNWERKFIHEGEPKRWNVIQITVESLSAAFLSPWGGDPELTPFLNKIAHQSFTMGNMYATGTRTVRGMEALTTLLPPTPGRSLLKRPYGNKVPTIAKVFQEHGYHLSFLYGGNGYFDNMNHFFSSAGYEIIDKPTQDPDSIEFENAWGASDGDLYKWALNDADTAFARGEPFHQFIMTTSNHRPYTYPDGTVAIPSGTGRAGSVQYTDYAIEQFIAAARSHPWFDDTIFLIVADHCDGSARKAELDVSKYLIPAIFYSPAHITPEWNTTLCSQIDVMPTLFGMLNWTWEGTNFGQDVKTILPENQRAYIGNYQKLGRLHNGNLTIISPLEEPHSYNWNRKDNSITNKIPDPEETNETIASYQGTDIYLTKFKNDAP